MKKKIVITYRVAQDASAEGEIKKIRPNDAFKVLFEKVLQLQEKNEGHAKTQ